METQTVGSSEEHSCGALVEFLAHKTMSYEANILLL